MEYVINTIWESDKEMSSKLVSDILSAADENVKNNVKNLHNDPVLIPVESLNHCKYFSSLLIF